MKREQKATLGPMMDQFIGLVTDSAETKARVDAIEDQLAALGVAFQKRGRRVALLAARYSSSAPGTPGKVRRGTADGRRVQGLNGQLNGYIRGCHPTIRAKANYIRTVDGVEAALKFVDAIPVELRKKPLTKDRVSAKDLKYAAGVKKRRLSGSYHDLKLVASKLSEEDRIEALKMYDEKGTVAIHWAQAKLKEQA